MPVNAELTRVARRGITTRDVTTEREETTIDHILRGLEQLKAQREKAEEADEYYFGEAGVTFASARVKRLLAKQGVTEDEIEDFNYAKIPADVVSNRLQIAAVVAAPAAENDDDSATEAAETAAVKAAEKAIADLRKTSQMEIQEKQLWKYAARHGEAFMFVWPRLRDGDDGTPADGDEAPDNAASRVEAVDMRVNSAHHVTIVYDEEDPLTPLYAIKSWEKQVEKKTVVRANLYYANRIERWTTEPGAKADDKDSWKKLVDAEDLALLDGSDSDTDAGDALADVAADEFSDPEDPDGLELGDIANPWGVIPWYHYRNDWPEGQPEHLGAYGPQQMINKMIYALAGLIDFTSYPQRYILSDPSIDNPLLNGVDPDHPDLEDDDPESESGTSGLSADPGAIWQLWGKMVGQFDPADPSNLLNPIDRCVKAMAELTDTPQHAFTKSSGDVPSGDALAQINRPTTDKIRDRQDRYSPPHQDAYELGLRMLGITGVTVEVRWKPAEVVNDSTGWAVLKAKADLGVPLEIVLEEGGYASEQVTEWLKDLNGAGMTQRVNMLVQLSTAAQGFAAAVTAGAVADSTVKALFDRFLRLTSEGTADPETTPDSFPAPEFRDPPPTNPAMAAVDAEDEKRKRDPDGADLDKELKRAQVDKERATAESSLASAEMLRAGAKAGSQPAKKAQPAKRVVKRVTRPERRPS